MKKLGKKIVLAFLLICVVGSMIGCGKSTESIIEDARKGVVRVLAVGDDLYTGSAFGVGKAGKETDIFVTNRHVVLDEDGEEVSEVYLLLDSRAFVIKDDMLDMDQNLMVRCDIVYVSPENEPDFAILRARQPVSGRMALPLLSAQEVSVSSNVYALGYPGNGDFTSQGDNLETLVADVEDVTVNQGSISRFLTDTQQNDTEVIQHTAIIEHGNSGGPLLNADGAVIGINTYGYVFNQLSGGVIDISKTYYSIEIDYVMKKLDELKESGKLDPGFAYDIYHDSFILYLVIGLVVLAAVLVAAALVLTGRKKAGAKSGGSNVTEPVVGGTVPVENNSKSVGEVVKPVQPNDSGLRFQGVHGVFAGKRYAINGTVRIGRDPAKNDLVYPADTSGISGVHCALLLEGDRILLKDLGSRYGTFLGSGQRLAANQAVQLQVGDKFYLGSEKQLFVITRTGGI